MLKSLVVGYGNSLRSDDGIGVCVAKTVEKWNMPQVRSLANHQLTPELAAELAQVDLAIFIDACQTNETDTIKLFPLKPSESMVFRSHLSEPQALLSLTKALFSRCPQAWWIIVPGVDFQLGERLSPMAQRGVNSALVQIKNLLLRDGVARICTK